MFAVVFINHDRVLHFGSPTSYVAALSLLSLGILYKFDSILITNEMTTKEKTKIQFSTSNSTFNGHEIT